MNTRQHPVEYAFELMGAQRFRDALNILSTHIRKTSQDWNAHHLAGQCHRFLGEFQKAIEHLSEANRLYPNHPPNLLALGIAYQLTERWAQSVAMLKEAIELDPDFNSAFNSLALTQKKMGALDAALNSYELGAKALLRRIVKSMTNNRRNSIASYNSVNGELWLTYAFDATLHFAVLSDVNRVAYPTDDAAAEEERTLTHEGLYWVDTIDKDVGLVRYFLPNYFNTLREILKSTPDYANLIGNRGVVLDLMKRHEDAQVHFAEAQEFMP